MPEMNQCDLDAIVVALVLMEWLSLHWRICTGIPSPFSMRKCRLTVTDVIRYHPGLSGCPDPKGLRLLRDLACRAVAQLQRRSRRRSFVGPTAKRRGREVCSVTNRCARLISKVHCGVALWCYYEFLPGFAPYSVHRFACQNCTCTWRWCGFLSFPNQYCIRISGQVFI